MLANSIIAILTSYAWVAYAVIGAIGGLLGALFAEIIRKPTLRVPLSLVFIIICLQVGHALIPVLTKQLAAEKIVNDLKNQQLFKIILDQHPQAEEELKKSMFDILASSSQEQAFYKSQAATAAIVNRYFLGYLASASEDATREYMLRNLNSLKELRNKPSLCVNYYLGQPVFGQKDLPISFWEEEARVKGHVIESSIGNKEVFSPLSLELVMQNLVASYAENGFDYNNISQLDKVSNLPPEQGCAIAIEFASAMTSMEKKKSVQIFKTLMSFSD